MLMCDVNVTRGREERENSHIAFGGKISSNRIVLPPFYFSLSTFFRQSFQEKYVYMVFN